METSRSRIVPLLLVKKDLEDLDEIKVAWTEFHLERYFTRGECILSPMIGDTRYPQAPLDNSTFQSVFFLFELLHYVFHATMSAIFLYCSMSDVPIIVLDDDKTTSHAA